MNFYTNILESKGPVIGDPYFLQTKEEIENWLKNHNVKKYSISKDLTIDVNGDVDISENDLTKIPVKFRKVTNDFFCQYNKLKSLKGCPDYIGGRFHCDVNLLTNLEYFPICKELYKTYKNL